MNDEKRKTEGGRGLPTIEAVHRDIALANQYRLELIKYLLLRVVRADLPLESSVNRLALKVSGLGNIALGLSRMLKFYCQDATGRGLIEFLDIADY